MNTVRASVDGEFVVAHTEYNFFGPKIGFDVFRFEHGRVVEHWDAGCLAECHATVDSGAGLCAWHRAWSGGH